MPAASRDLLNGASPWSIAAQWNSQGLKTVKGCDWTGGQVRQVLTRASNAGLVIYDVRAAQAEARKRGEPVHLAGIVEGAQSGRPAIVDRDVWESVCQLLADPKRHTGKSPGRKHLLSGIAICDACKKPLGTGVRHIKTIGKRPVYSCKQPGCMKIVRGVELTDKRVADVKALAGKPDAAERFAALPFDRQRGVIDTLVTVTIHALNRPGGPFDPAAITVDFERRRS